jgi:4,5-DOPA dioxygenase extradiol
LVRGDDAALIDWVGLAEDAQMSVPTDEHYPAAALRRRPAQPGDDVSFFNDVIEGGSISMTGVRIGLGVRRFIAASTLQGPGPAATKYRKTKQ